LLTSRFTQFVQFKRTIITNVNSQLQLFITSMSASVVHIILSHLIANAKLRLQVSVILDLQMTWLKA